MSLFLQAFLVALAVTIAFIDAHTTQTHIFRPIFIGPLVGAIMGDFNTGLQVGVTVELMFLAVIFVGTAVPPNPTISTAIATADYLRSMAPIKSKIYVIGESGLKLALEKRGFILTDDQPEYVVVGLDTKVTYEKLEKAVLLIRNGAKFIGTNADSNLPNERGMVPGAGSIVKLVEYATQVKPVMIGKPEAIIMKMALERVKLPKERVIMVGDNYHTDIEAAINVGMDSLLVYTGLSRPEEVIKEKIQPTYKVNNLDEWEI